MPWFLPAVAFFLGLLAASPMSGQDHDPDDAASGSLKPQIPEPLAFDLVRPLGAHKGEFEVNSLFLRSLTSGRIRWAPEVEYALPRGWALEFELPIEGRRVEDYKIAAQKTFGTLAKKRFIHGWQGFVEWERDGEKWNTNQVYISGFRFHRRWSTLSLNGLQVADRRTGRLALVSNHSVFYDAHRRWITGLETNLLQGQKTAGALRILPQAHWKTPKQFHLQFSLGVESRRGSGANPVAAWRFIREL